MDTQATICVSIHAPAGGATSSTLSFISTWTCFNPRARGGRDRQETIKDYKTRRFNPRARGGRDHCHQYNWLMLLAVSIHAPAGGATSFDSFMSRVSYRFNPRARGGRDRLAAFHRMVLICFNPRARGGRDLLGLDYVVNWNCFNPRARGGRDIGFTHADQSKVVSIHAPAGGATTEVHCSHLVLRSFNPRARGGRDYQGLTR